MATYPHLISDFLSFVKVNSRSDESSTTIPSSPRETAFLETLMKKLTDLGLSDVHQDPQSAYVFATVPANTDKKVKTLGFISHIDTADFNSENIDPQIVENYDGKSVIKLGDSGYELDPKVFPHLKNYAGHDLITTDGTTLLGADDKSGVAELFSVAEYLLAHPEVKHGDVRFGFGPDEEIGTGADHFNVADFNCDYAYTVDGGPLGELEYETFNAAQAEVNISGVNVHPGEAYGVMVNALQLAVDFQNALPAAEVPEKTQGREGFFFMLALDGTVDSAKMTYIIRDHDRDKFEARKALFKEAAAKINAQYDVEHIKIDMKDQYYNMREVIEKDMTVVDLAKQAMQELDIEPIIYPVRGGTDGSKISFMGLPTPNLFAGGENMHGRFEYVSEQVMARAVDVVLQIIKNNAK
ncbi:peptidase T [Lactiplantibacillus fabifermentans]|uniref:Peptidase T n=2 Tax=Lactiplantibacillus fabifermentans TaxID=483011 RepID=A0A0R2NL77_9LACO|nr:peptidase T [Lactiplantibacillus fabifermentans]ETY74259.1 peptidase T [Lactiplantibacillus fabifermentans T30PCM01]KRO23738.1 peptidase t [Lactiplantibacillus fabifermentans DSM 21115]